MQILVENFSFEKFASNCQTRTKTNHVRVDDAGMISPRQHSMVTSSRPLCRSSYKSKALGVAAAPNIRTWLTRPRPASTCRGPPNASEIKHRMYRRNEADLREAIPRWDEAPVRESGVPGFGQGVSSVRS